MTFRDHVFITADQGLAMVDYIQSDVAEGLWIVGLVHVKAYRYVSDPIPYFRENLNIHLDRVRIMDQFNL